MSAGTYIGYATHSALTWSSPECHFVVCKSWQDMQTMQLQKNTTHTSRPMETMVQCQISNFELAS